MKEMAEEFCWRIGQGEEPCWLAILGRSDLGKSITARAIAGWYRQHLAGTTWIGSTPTTRKVRYVYWPAWLKLIEDKGWKLSDCITDLGTTKGLVVVDDIGAEHQDKAGYLKSELHALAALREGKWTVFTSNKLLGQIETDIDARLASRMSWEQNLLLELPRHLVGWNEPGHPRHRQRLPYKD